MIETAVIVAIITMLGNVVCMIISSKNATNTAIINSNARAAQTEQKFTDAIEQVRKENEEIKERLNQLSETDSCCVILKDDVALIKENLEVMSASLNQLKAESTQADALQMKTNMLQLRHSINEGYRVFKEQGSIDQKSKDSLLALGDVYIKEYNGNSFVEDELDYLRTLKVV